MGCGDRPSYAYPLLGHGEQHGFSTYSALHADARAASTDSCTRATYGQVVTMHPCPDRPRIIIPALLSLPCNAGGVHSPPLVEQIYTSLQLCRTEIAAYLPYIVIIRSGEAVPVRLQPSDPLPLNRSSMLLEVWNPFTHLTVFAISCQSKHTTFHCVSRTAR